MSVTLRLSPTGCHATVAPSHIVVHESTWWAVAPGAGPRARGRPAPS